MEDALQFTDGAYHTAPRRIGWFARHFPSAAFYPQLVEAIFRASGEAQRGQYADREWRRTSLEVLRALESVGVQFEITGIEHLEQPPGPCVIVANHVSTMETGVLPVVIQPIRPVTFVVKQSLIDYPVFKHAMRARNPIAVTQTDPRRDLKTMLVEGAARLEQGISVLVFPQGRRTAVFDAAKFNTIGVKLAHKAGVPVVPLALATHAWTLGKGRLQDFGPIVPSRKARFAFAAPLAVIGRGADEQQAILEFITGKLRQWETEDRGKNETRVSK